MPSLSQLLADHQNALILDAASTQTQVGLLRTNQPARWQRTSDEAGRGLFASTKDLLTESGVRLDEVNAFIFCEGPGSMLGVRTVAMALRTWTTLKSRAVYSYQSLAIAARAKWRDRGPQSLSVVSDARRDSWHVQTIDAGGRLSPLERLSTDGLPAGELFTPENFRAWSKPPRPIAVCSYDLTQVFATLQNEDLFRVAENPDAFQHEAPEYRKWPAVVHSSETAGKK